MCGFVCEKIHRTIHAMSRAFSSFKCKGIVFVKEEVRSNIGGKHKGWGGLFSREDGNKNGVVCNNARHWVFCVQ